MSDLIAAIATGSIATAIGIVRVSGDGCFAACDRVFRPRNGVPFAQQPSHKMVFGEMLDDSGAVIDQGLAVRFGGGHSYTGEDSAEFHCHGSPVVLHTLLSALFAAGARQAQAGEFTKRAFLNGKMDLTEAEAVIDLIDAQSAAAAKNAAAQLDGGLRRRLEPVQEALIDITSRFYAVVDYPDEDIEDVQRQEMLDTLSRTQRELERLLATFSRGQLLKQGVPAVILGRPNAGKSSLLNALLGYDRAIVTDIAGTTRDTVEERVLVGGVLLRLTDTAGIRNSADRIEAMGVERSRQAAQRAALALLVLDGSQTLTDEDEQAMAAAEQTPCLLVLVNKSDLPQKLDTAALAERFPRVLHISAQTGAGLDALAETVAALYPAGETPAGELLTNARQADAVERALSAVAEARGALDMGMTPDVVLTDCEAALEALGELNGKRIREDLVDTIFSRFCVGK